MNQNWSINKQQDAWHLAAILHNGQSYGGHREGERIEYINHIGSVVFEIMNAIKHENDLEEELGVLCAILHDTLEDTEVTSETLENLFGKRVVDGVLALTKNTRLDKTLQMSDSLERIKQQPKEVWAVKMADRICNLYAPPFYWSNEKKASYLEEARVIHTQLKDGSSYLANRLLEKIERYKTFIH